MSLTARFLETNGIATVIIGSALDIVTHCGVPRYLHSDFPLGNPCGKPYDTGMQRAIVEQALRLIESATAANTVARTPFAWSEDNSWRDRYFQVNDSNREYLRELGERRRQQQSQAKSAGDQRAPMIS